MRHTFVSYSHEDADFAQNLAAKIRDAGFPSWVDADLSAGDNWNAEVEARIRDALAVLVVLSPYSAGSAYVNFEWAFALGSGVPVVPVLLKISPEAVPPRLGAVQFLDFSNHVNRPWNRLIDALREIAAAQRDFTVLVPRDAPPVVRVAAHTLDSMRSEERAAAIESLSQMDHPAAVEVLAEAARHPIREVRLAAAVVLADKGDIRALPALLEGVRRREDEIKQYMVEQLGEAAVPRLIEVLTGADAHLREFAMEALGAIGGDAAVRELVKLLAHQEREVQVNAAWALGTTRDSRVAGNLRELLPHADPRLRRAAVSALARCAGTAAIPDLIQMLEDPDRDIRHTVVCRLEDLCAAGLSEAQALEVIPALTGVLNDEYDQVSLFAAGGLRKLRDPRAVPGVIAALRQGVAWGGRRLLMDFGGLAVPALREVLNDGTARLRDAATEVLSKYGTEDDLRLVAAMVTDEDADVRIAALQGLGNRKAVFAFKQVAGALADEHESVAREAARTLGNLGDPRAVPYLIKCLEDEGVAEAAAESLKQFPAREARAAYRRWQKQAKT